jgi:hypothetical protein
MASQGTSAKSRNGIAEPRKVLPRLHLAAYQGDVESVRGWLKAGDDISDIVVLLNNNAQNVLGVTPLYLAAQEGHTEVCRLLLDYGADMNQKCCIPSTGEVFGADDIALVRLHLKTYWFLVNRKTQPRVAGRANSGIWAIGSLFGITPARSSKGVSQPLLA